MDDQNMYAYGEHYAEITEAILRDVCELEPANQSLNDTICVDVSDLKIIVDRALRNAQVEAAATAPLLERIAELEAESHNLNWALGTEGFDQMATPEEQAEHEKGHADVMANIAKMKARKERHDQLVPEGVDYLDHIAALTAQVEQAAQPVFWAPPERANTYHSQATETVYRTPMAGWRPLYTAPPKAEQWHVGDSGFESWYGQHLLTAPVHRGAKQLARDAYAAGMGERAATAPPKAVPLTTVENENTEAAQRIAKCLAVLRPVVKNKFPQHQALEELVTYLPPTIKQQGEY